VQTIVRGGTAPANQLSNPGFGLGAGGAARPTWAQDRKMKCEGRERGLLLAKTEHPDTSRGNLAWR